MTDLEFKLEELWDWIATEIGFHEKGIELQNGIREFVKLKILEAKEKEP